LNIIQSSNNRSRIDVLELLLYGIYVCPLIFLTALFFNSFLIAINSLMRSMNTLIRQLYLFDELVLADTLTWWNWWQWSWV